MDKQLKALAYAIVAEKKVDSKIVGSFLNSLSKNDLKTFVKYLRTALEKNTVTVTTAQETDTQTQQYFESKYPKHTVQFKKNDELGAGIVVKIGDDVYDYSVRNYLENTINTLTKEL